MTLIYRIRQVQDSRVYWIPLSSDRNSRPHFGCANHSDQSSRFFVGVGVGGAVGFLVVAIAGCADVFATCRAWVGGTSVSVPVTADLFSDVGFTGFPSRGALCGGAVCVGGRWTEVVCFMYAERGIKSE
jgi:hypothetical protein